jgi:threonyl-tRNA synthetase
MAMEELYPDIKKAMGPATDEGFYFDFDAPQGFKITPEDFPKIEAKMKEISKKKWPITKEIVSAAKAKEIFADNAYKLEFISEIEARGEEVSLYWFGTPYANGSFGDLCAGPHVDNMNEIGAFKLMSVAGAYWRGNSKNKMLIRIYGTAFPTQAELDAYINMREEAIKRDHRKIGAEMGLFHFQGEAPGAVFWHDKGWTAFRLLQEYMRKRQQIEGYSEVSTPTVLDKAFWELSGHWAKYRENMYTATALNDEKIFAIKPMNCPGGLQIYKQGIKSYRDLPIRMAEFGKVHRYESSGSLFGLMRVREFTQDDAHIFCTPEQLEAEAVAVVKLIIDIYKDFGFGDVKIKLSTRPAMRIGDDKIWDIAEKALQNSLENNGYAYTLNEGEGAFYGPKLEFVLKDAIGRDWQCGTLQLDMNLPERLDINYVNEKGEQVRPIMLHRALFGSLERFFGILIENTMGHLPMWLAPTQMVIANITEGCEDYARKVYEDFKKKGLRVVLDLRSEKISYKIREHSEAKVPVIAVIGKKEAEENKLTLRFLGKEEQEVKSLAEALEFMKETCAMPKSTEY